MTPTQIELHNAHKARLQRIAAAAARLNPKTDSEFSAALNAVEEPNEAKAAIPKDKWAEYQIEKHKPLWFSIVRNIKVTRLGGPCIKDIQKATADVFEVSFQKMMSDYRGFRVTRARQVAAYLANELTTISVNRIARAFNRDHSTVGHSIRQIEHLIKTDNELAAKVAMVRERFDETVNRRNDAEDPALAAQETARPPFDADSAGKAAICSAR